MNAGELDSGNRLEPYLKALLIIEIERREADASAGSSRKPESLLVEAGFDVRQVAELLGKNYDAVRKSIARSRSAAAN